MNSGKTFSETKLILAQDVVFYQEMIARPLTKFLRNVEVWKMGL